MPSAATKFKGGKVGGKLSAKATRRLAPHAGKAAWKLGKAEAKLVRRALSSREPRGQRYFKYGLFVLLGVGVGALLSRSKNKEQVWGSDSSNIGSRSGYSSPASGPLIGSDGEGAASAAYIPEQNDEAKQRISSLLGEDPRTSSLPRVNVEVIRGVAELRGVAPDTASRQAAGEIAAGVEGVSEVKNLISVG